MTRLADISGLDRVGLPVFQAVRPMARSLSVAQGKGLTSAAAQVSALMEAIETHAAEMVPEPPLKIAAAELEPERAPLWQAYVPSHRQQHRFDCSGARAWLPATDLVTGEDAWVPWEMVSMDGTRPGGADARANTTGLASGNGREEAEVAALAELIERDAHRRWLDGGIRDRRDARLDLAGVADGDVRALLAQFAAAGVEALVWDLSGAWGVATFVCILHEPSGSRGAALPPATGGGCHPSRAVALLRALTEAAQTRAGLVSGARDDILSRWFERPAAMTRTMLLETAGVMPARRRWRDVPDRDFATCREDRDWLVGLLRARGREAILSASLLAGEISVVKLVVPGLRDLESVARRGAGVPVRASAA